MKQEIQIDFSVLEMWAI